MSDRTVVKKSNTDVTSASKRYSKYSRLGEVWHRLKKNKGAVVGLVILALLLLTMILSFIFISNDDITKLDVLSGFQKPSMRHPFGTDEVGRDLFLRTLYATRYSLIIGGAAMAMAVFVGLLFGATAGYYGGIYETIIMRGSDILSSIPGLLLGMVIIITLGQSLWSLIIAISVSAIPAFIRIARASVMTIKNSEYIEAARSIALSDFRIIFTQVVPNGLSPIIVTVTTRIGAAIMESAGLSFLGFGIPAPEPEWGALVSAGRDFITTAPHLCFFPGCFILITVLAFNLLGDGLRDALDPKLKR